MAALPTLFTDIAVILGALLSFCLIVGSVAAAIGWVVRHHVNGIREITEDVLREVKSPNGSPTSSMVYEMWKVQQLQMERQGELRQYAKDGREAQRGLQASLDKHMADDDRRFDQIGKHFGIGNMGPGDET